MTTNDERIAAARKLEGYTPGPWCVSPTDDTTIIALDRSVVAEIDGDYNEPDLWPIMEANARVVAAAPDLHRLALDLAAERERLREALIRTAASLVAAISLLERGGKKAAASDTMFAAMLKDYQAAVDKARAALNQGTIND